MPIVSTHAEVRAAMLAVQRQAARGHDTVMVGRDIGTVVLPDADLKVFLTASVETGRDAGAADGPARPVGDLPAGDHRARPNRYHRGPWRRSDAPPARSSSTRVSSTSTAAWPRSSPRSRPGRPVTRDHSRYLPRTWAYRPAGIVVGLLIRVLGGARTEGLENLPRTGPAIIVANHYTLADPMVAGWSTCWQIGRVVHMIAKIQIKGWPWPAGSAAKPASSTSGGGRVTSRRSAPSSPFWPPVDR